MVKEVHINTLFIILALLTLTAGISYIFTLQTPEELQADMPPSEIRAAEDQEPLREIIIEQPEAPIAQQPEAPKTTISDLTSVLIQISRYSFDKMDITIQKGTTVTWKNLDTRRHRIACYTTEKQSNQRFYFGEIMLEGGKNTYTFNEPGRFLCIDAVFGIRGFVNVEEKQPLTGNAILAALKGSLGSANAFLIFISIAVALTLLYSLYKHEGHHFF